MHANCEPLALPSLTPSDASVHNSTISVPMTVVTEASSQSYVFIFPGGVCPYTCPTVCHVQLPSSPPPNYFSFLDETLTVNVQ